MILISVTINKLINISFLTMFLCLSMNGSIRIHDITSHDPKKKKGGSILWDHFINRGFVDATNTCHNMNNSHIYFFCII